MTGVDPSPAILDVARHRPDGERVRWIEGDASLLDEAEYDLAIMTGHVAQVITDDQRWRETLAATYRALRPGGRVTFESRNPSAREWTTWTRRPAVSSGTPRSARSRCGSRCSPSKGAW